MATATEFYDMFCLRSVSPMIHSLFIEICSLYIASHGHSKLLQWSPTAAPMYLQPRTEPGICFHDVPLLATIHGAIVETGTSTTPAGMAMALAYKHAPRHVAISKVGTSREGEAGTLLLCTQ